MYAADDERFDIVDVDSFGVDNFVDAALPMVKHGGYAYVTCTDALALCGKNPRECRLASAARTSPRTSPASTRRRSACSWATPFDAAPRRD